MKPLYTETYRGLTIALHHDPDCESPRECDNLGTIIAWHQRYRLADKRAPIGSIDGPEKFNPEADEHAICLPVYMYEHSGVALSTGEFGDRWDSGQVGWIYVTKDQMLSEYGTVTPTNIEQAIAVLKSEIDEYSKYLNGECYGFIVSDPDGKHLDSCWGFLGFDYSLQAAKESADGYADDRDLKSALRDAGGF